MNKEVNELLEVAIGEQRGLLKRDPRILIVSHSRLCGIVKSSYPGALVLEHVEAESLEVIFNPDTKRPEIQVNRVPLTDLAPTGIYDIEGRVIYFVEVEKSRIVAPVKRLIVPA